MSASSSVVALGTHLATASTKASHDRSISKGRSNRDLARNAGRSSVNMRLVPSPNIFALRAPFSFLETVLKLAKKLQSTDSWTRAAPRSCILRRYRSNRSFSYGSSMVLTLAWPSRMTFIFIRRRLSVLKNSTHSSSMRTYPLPNPPSTSSMEETLASLQMWAESRGSRPLIVSITNVSNSWDSMRRSWMAALTSCHVLGTGKDATLSVAMPSSVPRNTGFGAAAPKVDLPTPPTP